MSEYNNWLTVVGCKWTNFVSTSSLFIQSKNIMALPRTARDNWFVHRISHIK